VAAGPLEDAVLSQPVESDGLWLRKLAQPERADRRGFRGRVVKDQKVAGSNRAEWTPDQRPCGLIDTASVGADGSV
jgi:hypothetical protein